MKLKTLVTAVLTGVAASFAHGAVTITSPADYTTVSTYSSGMKAFLAKSLADQQTAVKTSGGDTRTAYQADYRANSLPVTLKWSGSSGSCTVTVKRSSDGKQVMSKTLTGTSVDFTDYEVGRNYTWTVKNGTTTVTGHFYVDRNAPYCIPIETSKISDARCVGGWKTSSGKVVKQGMIYRSAQFDWYYNDSAMYAYWKDKVGVKTEIELRDTDQVVEVREAQGQGLPLTGSTFGSDVTYYSPHAALGKQFMQYANVISTADGKAAMKAVFAYFCNAANYPILFHCAQGRDRTGSLAFLLGGLLGVSDDDLLDDYMLTIYGNSDFTYASSKETSNKWISCLTKQLDTSYPPATYTTRQAQCEKYFKDIGISDDKIATFRSLMLEDAETAASSSEEPTLMDEHDEVTYRPYWWFRDDTGGTWISSSGYFYTDETATKKCKDVYGSADGVRYPDAYDALLVMKPNAKYPYSSPSCSSFKLGKIITNAANGEEVYLGNPKFEFQNLSVSTRTLWRHEAGRMGGNNIDLTLTGTGTGSIDLYRGAVLAVSDLRVKSASNIFLRFAPNSTGAGLSIGPKSDSDIKSDLGWFEGGSAGDTQTFAVSNAFLRFTSASKICKVNGALDFSFILGDYNKTTTATAPFDVSGSLVINAGSRMTVDAGQKAAGTYPLITVGSGKTLTCDASLCENASVTGLKSGTTGAVVKSGNQINLVIANASGKTVVTVPTISATSATYTGSVQKPTFSPSSSNYTVNYGSGDYKSVGPYTITLSLVNTTSYVWGDGTTAAKTYSYEIKSGSDPGPTDYGPADTKAVTYTWKGGSAPWAYTTSWTPGSGATYGIPNHKTYATADFPASLTAATTCTVANSAAVSKAHFDSPNLTLVIDNATLTVAHRLEDAHWSVYNFGNSATGDQKLVFKGANPGLDETPEDWIVNLGYVPGGASGSCTLRFEVPASNWAQAPLRTAAQSSIKFSSNVRFEIDATALGVPSSPVTVPLAVAQGGFRFGDDLESILSRSQLSFASGAQGAVSISGNDLVLTVTGGGTPHPEPEPTPTAAFDAAHTIVCYGDSLTWGAAATEITMDDRENFFEGRLAGVAEVPQSYPYWLSELVPSSYNVISQARSGSQTCNITSWSGEQAVIVEKPFTLPAVGSVSVATNFVFQNPQGWGKWGGWAVSGKTSEEKIDNFNRWAGFVTPIFPLYEPYGEAKTRYSITGTLGGRHVRLQGLHPTNITVTVFGEGTEKTVAAGDEFIPDNERIEPYKNAIRIICTGANDADDALIGERYATHIKPLLQAFAAKGGRYLIVSPEVNMGSASGSAATAIEAQMASDFGENYLNLRLRMVNDAKTTAEALGVPFTGKWTATNGTGLKGDPTHFNSKGYKVMAEFIRQKLVQLGYLEGEEPPPVEMKDYYYSKTQVAGVYQSTKTWYKNAACSTGWSAYPNGYDAAVHFAPNAGIGQIVVLDDWLNALTGEVTFDGSASLRYGSQTFENNASTPKPVWIVRGGEAGGVCLTLTLAGSGSGYVDILGGASAAFTSSTLSDKLSIRFNPSDCANASLRFDGWDGDGRTTFEALTGGAAGTTQTLTVSSNCWVEATSTTVASGVAGPLAMNFILGEKNTVESEVPLKFAGAFTANAGSTLTVDATGKSAGTYPLLAAGTLTVPADLAASATVMGLASGLGGTVVKNGNRLDLVIASVTPPGPDPDRALKVLAIGNSFSKSLTYESGLAEIAQNLGKKLDFFNLYYGGCSLQQHWEHHDKKNFYNGFDDKFVTKPNGVSGLTPVTASLDDVLAAEPWDIVTLQQNSDNSGALDTYEPYFGNLVNLIKVKAPTAKIWIHQTWSRQGGKLVTSKKTYADYDEMYDDICANYQAMATQYGIDTIIPVGYAVQLARHEQNYDPLSTDNQHLRTPAGSYMQSCVWAAKLFGLDVTAVTCKPSSVDATTAAMLRAVAQKAAVATDLTDYGATADKKCATYTWKGGDGLWEQAANWTPDAYGTYGIPHAKTAQAVFPASLTEQTVCTVTEDHTVSNLVFDSANLTLRLDNAKLTVVDSLHDGTYGAYNFGLSGAGDTKLVIAGAKAGLVAAHSGVRASIGSQTEGSAGICTVRFEVPETGWETEAPLQTPSRDSNVRFKSNVRFEIDATALGVPAEGKTNAVTLAYGTDKVHFDGAEGTSEAENFAALVERSSFVFASGATGELVLDGYYLKLLVTNSSTPGPVPTPGGLTTNAMADASWGYEIRGLGTAGNEVALVYTNPAPETAMAWPVPAGVTSFDFLVVGGGGGGGGTGGANAGGGGGGAGAVRTGTVTVSGGESCAVVVGKGGAAGTGKLKTDGPAATAGGDGGLSSLTVGSALYDALGGGGGGQQGNNGRDGGCAGGGGSKDGASGAVLASSDGNAYGNVGGAGATINYGNYTYPGAGGGGASLADDGKGGKPSKVGTSQAKAGDGGNGVVCAITGEEIAYGGGGGGGASKNDSVCQPGSGGLGGGGVGYWKSAAGKGVDGLGGGGGGAGNGNVGTNGARGGSGVVVIRYALGSAEDPIPEEIKTGKSGDVITVPVGATVDVSDPTKLVVNGKEYAVKDHYVFVAKEAGVVLEIAPDEAVIADISIAADGTVTVTSDKAFELFRYALESADNLGFENATTTAFLALDASKTLSVKKDGETRFYRLVVRD